MGAKGTVHVTGPDAGDVNGASATLCEPGTRFSVMIPGPGIWLDAGFTLNGYKQPAKYSLTSPNIGYLQLGSGVKAAVTGSVTIQTDGTAGTWSADFATGDHVQGSFSC
jgi:hypothetical protein